MIHQHLRPRGRIIGISSIVGSAAGDALTKECNQFRAAFIQQSTKSAANRTESFPLGYQIRSIWLPIKDGGIAAKLSGVGSITASIKSLGRLSATLTGTGTVTPSLNIGLQMQAALSGAGQISTATLKSAGRLAASIRIGASPSSTEIADAIWSRSSVPFTEPNTMGKKLNDAGNATNPWSADLASNNTAGTFGWFVQKLLTVAKFLGLK